MWYMVCLIQAWYEKRWKPYNYKNVVKYEGGWIQVTEKTEEDMDILCDD